MRHNPWRTAHPMPFCLQFALSVGHSVLSARMLVVVQLVEQLGRNLARCRAEHPEATGQVYPERDAHTAATAWLDRPAQSIVIH
eukprot:COSAG01_NODE_161_length_23642_cov_713.337000_11_plen_84_part_00